MTPTLLRRLVVVVSAAAVAAACSGGGLASPEEALGNSSEPESSFGYVVGQVPDGYELCAVSVPSALSLRPTPGPSLLVYADGLLDDPYAGPLLGVALFDAVGLETLALGDTVDVEVQGSPARLGSTDGFQLASLPAASGQVLTWALGDGRIVQLASRHDGTEIDGARGRGEMFDLVALARAVIVADGVAALDVAALPDGFVHMGDLYELEGRSLFRFSVDYQRVTNGVLDDPLTLLGSSGDEAAMDAFRFRAASSQRVTIQGRPGVTGDIGMVGEGPFVASWLTDDGLILRLFSFTLEPPELAAIAETLERADGEKWAGLIDKFGSSACQLR